MKQQHQEVLKELEQDSLLNIGELPQLVPLIGLKGQYTYSKKIDPFITSGLSFRYKNWSLESQFGINASINTDSLTLDFSERWLVDTKIKYHVGPQKGGIITTGHSWQNDDNFVTLGGGYTWRTEKDKIFTLYSDINYHYDRNEWGVGAGLSYGFGGKGLGAIAKGFQSGNSMNPSQEFSNPSLKILDDLKSMQNLSVGEAIGMLTKALNIGNTVSIAQQNPLKVMYSPSIQLPVSESFTFGLGPNIAMTYDSLHTDWSFGGRIFMKIQPKKWLPYLQMEYSGLYEADSVAFSSEGVEKSAQSSWKSDVLIGAGYSLKIGKRLTIEGSAMRRMGWVDAVTDEPWQFQLSTKTDLPFAGDLNNLEMPEAQIDLGKFLKLGGGMNMTLGENPGIELAPQIYKQLGAKKKLNVGVSPLVRYSKVEDKDLWVYGGRIYSQYTPWKGFPHLDSEIEGMNASDPFQPEYQRHWYPSFRAGTGYTFQFGDFFGISFQLMYSFIYEEENNPIQNDPWVFRIGFSGIGGV